jgi:peroxiredoxin
MPDFEAAFQKYKGQDVEFIAIQALGLDTVQNGQDFVKEFGLSYAIGPDADSSILVNYKVSGFPSTVFLDKEHRVVRHWTGALNAAKLVELVQEALNASS